MEKYYIYRGREIIGSYATLPAAVAVAEIMPPQKIDGWIRHPIVQVLSPDGWQVV